MHILVVIEHNRMKLFYFNVTPNPTAEWSRQQIRNLLFDFDIPFKYLNRDMTQNMADCLAVKRTDSE